MSVSILDSISIVSRDLFEALDRRMGHKEETSTFYIRIKGSQDIIICFSSENFIETQRLKFFQKKGHSSPKATLSQDIIIIFWG